MPKEFQESTWSIDRAVWETSHDETEPPAARTALKAAAAARSAWSIASLGFGGGF